MNGTAAAQPIWDDAWAAWLVQDAAQPLGWLIWNDAQSAWQPLPVPGAAPVETARVEAASVEPAPIEPAPIEPIPIAAEAAAPLEHVTPTHLHANGPLRSEPIVPTAAEPLTAGESPTAAEPPAARPIERAAAAPAVQPAEIASAAPAPAPAPFAQPEPVAAPAPAPAAAPALVAAPAPAAFAAYAEPAPAAYAAYAEPAPHQYAAQPVEPQVSVPATPAPATPAPVQQIPSGPFVHPSAAQLIAAPASRVPGGATAVLALGVAAVGVGALVTLIGLVSPVLFSIGVGEPRAVAAVVNVLAVLTFPVAAAGAVLGVLQVRGGTGPGRDRALIGLGVSGTVLLLLLSRGLIAVTNSAMFGTPLI